MKRYPQSPYVPANTLETTWSILMRSQIDATALALILRDKFPALGEPQLLTTPEEALKVTVGSFVVVSNTFAPSRHLPRLVQALSTRGSRVLLLTDGRSAQDLTAASLAGAINSFDTRDPLGHLLISVQMTLIESDRNSVQSDSLWVAPKPVHRIRLTASEQRIVDAIFEPNATRATVARILGVSVNTVNNHLANIRGKLGQFPVRNLSSLRYALEESGLLERYPTSTSNFIAPTHKP